MIEQLSDLPQTVVGFRATGKVSKDDYEKILIPAVDELAKRTGKVNFLLWVDTDISNYTFGAWVDDLLVGIKHITQWHNVAIVSHYESIKKITNAVGHILPGTFKGFKTEDLEVAKKWVAEN